MAAVRHVHARGASVERGRRAWTLTPQRRRDHPMHLRTPAILATAAALSLGATACGSDDSSTSSSSGSTSQQPGGQAGRPDRLADRQVHGGHARRRLRRRADPAQADPEPGRRRVDLQVGRRELPDHGRQREVLQARHRLPVRSGRDRPRRLRPAAQGRRQDRPADRLRRRPRRLGAHRQGDRRRQGGRRERPAVLPRRPHAEAAGGQGQRHRRARGHDRQVQGRVGAAAQQDVRRGRPQGRPRGRRRQDHASFALNTSPGRDG